MLKRTVLMFFVGASAALAFTVVSCGGKNKANGTTDGGPSSTSSSSGDGGSQNSSGSSTSSSGGNGTCATDSSMTCASLGDCPNSTNFKCDPGSSCCIFFCMAPTDCGGQYDNSGCKGSALGCICDQGVCKAKQCSADVDCGQGGEVCKGGACTAPDPVSAAASVVVEPDPASVHVGVPQPFTATVLDSKGGPVILAAGSIAWSVDKNGSIDAKTGIFTPSTASTTADDTTITATVTGANGVAGTAKATVYGAPAANTIQLTLIDGQAGVPVTDATVQYSDASGNLIGTAVTSGSAMGVYALTQPAGAVLLNVFDANYQYISILVTDLPTDGDLVLFLTQNPVNVTVSATSVPVVGGYTGNFVDDPGILDPNGGEPASEQGDIHFGVAGVTLPQDLLDMSLNSLLGPSHKVTINVGGSHPVNLPQGIEIGFGATWFTCSYDGLGAPGGCGLPPCGGSVTTNCVNSETDPTKEDWAHSAFACGQRSAWGLGGGIPFSAISGELGALAGGGANVGAILGAILPEFSGFNSGVAYDVQYTMAPPVPADTVVDPCSATKADYTDTTPIADPSKLNADVHLSLDTPLALMASVTGPALPTIGGTAQQNVIVLAGAVEQGLGLLPLGLSAGTTLDANNNPSGNGETCDTDNSSACTPNGHITLHFAPEHGGAERSEYGIVALVFNLSSSSFTGSSPGSKQPTSISGLVKTFPAAQGLPYKTPVTLPAYLPYAEHDTYAARAFTHQALTGPSWMRLRFQDDAGRQWVTYFDPAANSFKLPAPPAGFSDRTFDLDGKTQAETEVQAVEAASGGLTLQNFLDFGNSSGVAGADVIDTMAAFNSVQICPATGC